MGERVDKKTLAEITVNSWGPKGCAHALGYARTEAARADFGAFHKPHTDSVTQQRNLIGINPDKKKISPTKHWTMGYSDPGEIPKKKA